MRTCEAWAGFVPEGIAHDLTLTSRGVVHVDETEIAICDLRGGTIAAAPVNERLKHIPPDRAANREADVTGDAGSLLQPMRYSSFVGAAAQYDASNIVTPTRPNPGGYLLAILASIYPLDLPDVRFDRPRASVRSREASSQGGSPCRIGPCLRQ
jgi:hypothetical protein